MVDTFPSYVPDLNASRKREPKILRADFGDGYLQATGDGINPYKETWDMSFSNRTIAEINEIKTFLDDKNGAVSFYWTPPDEAPLTPNPKRWVQIGPYTESKTGPHTKSISFEIERVQTI